MSDTPRLSDDRRTLGRKWAAVVVLTPPFLWLCYEEPFYTLALVILGMVTETIVDVLFTEPESDEP